MRPARKSSLWTSFVLFSLTFGIVQASYGNYPCRTNGAADQTKCVDPSFPDSNRQCVASGNGEYACGVEGAPCQNANDCDGGQCKLRSDGQVCTGGPGYRPQAGETCLGRLSSTRSDGSTTVCGGYTTGCRTDVYSNGAFQFFYADNSLCTAEFCNPTTQQCIGDGRPGSPCEGADSGICTYPSTCGLNADGMSVCGADGTSCFGVQSDEEGTYYPRVDSACISGYCERDSGQCAQRPPTPSGRARQRRNQIAFAKFQCPPRQEACSLVGSFGYECVDTLSNIERCGSCDGHDCSELPGVDRVNCYEGTCIILSCAHGHRYDEIEEACVTVEQWEAVEVITHHNVEV